MVIWKRCFSKIGHWYESKIIVDKNSKFQSRHVEIVCKDDIDEVLTQLRGIKEISKASHPHMIAWKVNDRDMGFNDGGEKGAGSRLLDLLLQYKLNNILVICTRWYGGKPLGGARFRHIKHTAVDSLKRGNKIP
jgi:putative IMPACT (imprinted ancient) family translation regulator